MALKADREVEAVEVGYFLDETASKGVVVVISTAGSGVALEDTKSVATVAANSSGNKPLGILLNEFVNVDLTRTPINWHQDQAQKGAKAAIMTRGWVVTDQIIGTPNGGDFACLTSSGSVTGVSPGAAWNEAANPRVGRFRTKKDALGFARVHVNL
jgi:hypothetical protein